jgi:hypothetical protein
MWYYDKGTLRHDNHTSMTQLIVIILSYLLLNVNPMCLCSPALFPLLSQRSAARLAPAECATARAASAQAMLAALAQGSVCAYQSCIHRHAPGHSTQKRSFNMRSPELDLAGGYEHTPH